MIELGFSRLRIITAMRLPLAAIALVLSLALLSGCGGDDDDGSTTTNESAAPAAQSQQANEDAEGNGQRNAAAQGQQGNGAAGGGEVEPEEEVLERAEEEFRPKRGYDNSIQEFGEEPSEEESSEVVDAMFSFFRAMASSDHKAICDGLTKANVEQLETFLKLKDKQGSCETVLQEILSAQVSEAKKSAAGTVYQVREEDGNAFVLFVPQGGVASYFVMKNEDGAWKATSVTAGTPIDPTADRP